MDLLDVNATQLHNDGTTMNRIYAAIALDQGISWADGMQQFMDAFDQMRAFDSGGTLRDALNRTRSDPDRVAENVELCEKRDAAVARALEQGLKAVPIAETDQAGMIMLDQGAGGGKKAKKARKRLGAADVATILHDPIEQERRFQRMRRAQPGYWDEGDRSRRTFLEDDRRFIEAGVDMVATAEQQSEIARAQQPANEVARLLDASIVANVKDRNRLRLLDEEIAKLSGERGLERLKSAQTEKGLRLLDGRAPAKPKGKKKGGKKRKLSKAAKEIRARIEAQQPADVMHALRLLQQDASVSDPNQTAHLEVFLHYMHSKKLDAASTPAATAAGQAVHSNAAARARQAAGDNPGAASRFPAGTDLHEAVMRRIRERGGDPARDYPDTVLELLGETG